MKAASSGPKSAPRSAPRPQPEPSPEDEGGTLILDHLPGHLIRRLQQVAVSLFAEEMEGAGADLTPVQYAALATVRAHPGIDQASLAGVIGYDRTTIGGVVERLEGKDLIRRIPSPSDRRLRQLFITPEGMALLVALSAPVLKVQERILEPLTPAERATLSKLLVKLVNATNELSRTPTRPALVRDEPRGPLRR
ncbi:MarR family winged helix-turn-helix transcriptional regulator [Xanthobacter autotrophicus]|uniref:MarR family winged helix-turn-helix transcriptional regulator n=1 Tax=Xanthobacter autotrophicus TaxID=280 RepID=UPI0024A6D9C4|nr:MarR family transcriptional regulator [Xanthobacter autotrophicus]MDI4657556.1 MarR family transcriptional regulator [Xanthobacter autotrophicus]